MGECRFGGAATRPHDEVDVGHLVAFTDERFTDAESVHLCHRHSSKGNEKDLTPNARLISLLSASGSQRPDRLARYRLRAVSQSLLRADGKMVRKRWANKVATVRSALVPGLMPRCLSHASHFSRSSNNALEASPNCTRACKGRAARHTWSAVSAPYLRTMWLSGNAARNSR